MKKFITLLVAIVATFYFNVISADKIIILPLVDEIDARAWQHTRRACEKAVNEEADQVVIKMNT